MKKILPFNHQKQLLFLILKAGREGVLQQPRILAGQGLGSGGGASSPGGGSGFGLTVKGDIHTHNGSADVALGIGADGTVMTADSAQATGNKWAAPAAPLLNVITKNADYDALVGDDAILCDPSGGAFTITFYAASGNSGKEITITNIDVGGNIVTIDPDSGAGEKAHTYTTIEAGSLDSYTFYCDGADWWLR